MTTGTLRTTAADILGVNILVGDIVVITAWGAPIRLIDTGKRATVTGITARGNVVLDDSGYPEGIANGRAVSPGCLAVTRRDGEFGHEGNRPRCTCGGRDFASCLCDISPADFYRSSRA